MPAGTGNKGGHCGLDTGGSRPNWSRFKRHWGFNKMSTLPGARLAQSVEHATPDLQVVSSSPTLGVELTLKK